MASGRTSSRNCSDSLEIIHLRGAHVRALQDVLLTAAFYAFMPIQHHMIVSATVMRQIPSIRTMSYLANYLGCFCIVTTRIIAVFSIKRTRVDPMPLET